MVQLYITILLAFTVCTGFLDQGVAPGSSTDTVYMVSKASRSWNEAREVCGRNGGHLVSILNSTEWNLWEYLMSPELDTHPRPSSTYWLGIHAPNASNPDAFYWDTCQSAVYRDPLLEEAGPAYQCVHAWFNREVFNDVFMNMWLRGDPCNQAHAFICDTNQDPVCTSQCDELVFPETSDSTCLDACQGSLPCTATYNATMGVCHMKVNRTQSDDYLAICWLATLDINQTCTQDSTFSIPTDLVDNNVNVSNTTCIDPNTPSLDRNPVNSSTNNTTTSSTDEPVCLCSCDALETFLAEPQPETANLTVEEKIEIIVKELSIDKKNTTSAQRGRVSVMDYRASSVGIGAVGAGIIVGIFGIIVIIDLSRLWTEIVKALRKIVMIVKNNKVEATP